MPLFGPVGVPDDLNGVTAVDGYSALCTGMVDVDMWDQEEVTVVMEKMGVIQQEDVDQDLTTTS